MTYLAELLLNTDSEGARHTALKWIYSSDGTEADYWSNVPRWGYTKKSLSKILKAIGYQVLVAQTCLYELALGFVAVK